MMLLYMIVFYICFSTIVIVVTDIQPYYSYITKVYSGPLKTGFELYATVPVKTELKIRRRSWLVTL